MEIKTLVAKAHENAVKHGFWEPPLAFGTAIALIHSELSEKKTCASTEAESPKAWPSNWLTR